MTLLIGLLAIGGAIALGVVALLAKAPVGSPAAMPDGAVSVTGGSLLKGAPGQAAPRRSARAVQNPEELPALLSRAKGLATKLTPTHYSERLQRRLDLAGNPPAWPAARVLAFKGAGLVIGGLIGLLLGAHGSVSLLLYPAVGAAAGFWLPDVLVRNAGEKRQIELLKGLPDALDMMTVCVEAGLGFDAALSRVARNLEGPMAEECARVLQEMQIGKSRTDALRALVDRTDVSELRTFISSLVQASELGISIGSVLREQAKEMRIRRRQRAEEKAQKLPVKILMPLIACLLPAMFIVVLGPAVIQIMHTLGNLSR